MISRYDRIEREMDRQIEMVEEDFEAGLISEQARNRLVCEIEREARAELRDLDDACEDSGGGWW